MRSVSYTHLDVYKRQVYYRTRKFEGYGKLSHKNLDDLQSGGRALLVTGEDEKEDPLDFVLWKPKKEGEPAWQSPWSAVSYTHLDVYKRQI